MNVSKEVVIENLIHKLKECREEKVRIEQARLINRSAIIRDPIEFRQWSHNADGDLSLMDINLNILRSGSSVMPPEAIVKDFESAYKRFKSSVSSLQSHGA